MRFVKERPIGGIKGHKCTYTTKSKANVAKSVINKSSRKITYCWRIDQD